MKFLPFLALFLMIAAPVRAETLSTDARAQVLKGQIEGFLEHQRDIAAQNGCTLTVKGDVMIEKADSYYALTLPHLRYTDAKGIRTEIGTVSINAIPQGTHEWKMTVALPTPMISFQKNNAGQFRIDIGAQNASGIWNEKLAHFTSLNAAFGNIKFMDVMDKDAFTIGSVTFNSSLSEQDPGAFTGTARAEFENIAFQDNEAKFNGKIPHVTLTTTLADRAEDSPMTKEQVKNRTQGDYPEAYNIFAFLFGAPERVIAQVTGLAALNSTLQQSLLKAPPQARQKIFAGVAGVSAVDAMGKPIPGDTNTKTYDVTFGANGDISLNGTDMGNMKQFSAQPAVKKP